MVRLIRSTTWAPSGVRTRSWMIREMSVVSPLAAALAALTPTDEPLTEQIRAGIARAAQAIDSGAAKKALERWVAASNR